METDINTFSATPQLCSWWILISLYRLFLLNHTFRSYYRWGHWLLNKNPSLTLQMQICGRILPCLLFAQIIWIMPITIFPHMLYQHLYIYRRTHTRTHTHTHIQTHAHTHTYIYVNIYIYICEYIYIYIYINEWINKETIV